MWNTQKALCCITLSCYNLEIYISIICLIAIAIMYYMHVFFPFVLQSCYRTANTIMHSIFFCVLYSPLWIALMFMCNKACVLQSPIFIALTSSSAVLQMYFPYSKHNYLLQALFYVLILNNYVLHVCVCLLL